MEGNLVLAVGVTGLDQSASTTPTNFHPPRTALAGPCPTSDDIANHLWLSDAIYMASGSHSGWTSSTSPV